MAKITRAISKLFGSTAGASEIAEFGSLAAGTPAFSTNVATIQSLSQFLGGWFDAVIGGNSPAIEDMNALFYVLFYQVTYIMQTGVPEYESSTVYYEGSMVSGNDQIYTSLTDANTGNALTSVTNWRQISTNQGRPKSITFSDSPYTVTAKDPVLAVSTAGGNVVVNLPTLATGFVVEVTKTTSDANTVTVTPNGAETVNGAASDVIDTQYSNKSYRPLSIGWVIK